MLSEPARHRLSAQIRVLAPFTHRALNLKPPQPRDPPPTPTVGEIKRHDRLGGLIHAYYRDAARRATPLLAPFRA